MPILYKVFICYNGKCASSQDVQTISDTMTDLIKAHAMDQFDAAIRVKCMLSGCLDVCQNGPVMVVHPGAIYYQHVDRQGLQRIFDQHLLRGEIVEEFVFHREEIKPGN